AAGRRRAPGRLRRRRSQAARDLLRRAFADESAAADRISGPQRPAPGGDPGSTPAGPPGRAARPARAGARNPRPRADWRGLVDGAAPVASAARSTGRQVARAGRLRPTAGGVVV